VDDRVFSEPTLTVGVDDGVVILLASKWGGPMPESGPMSQINNIAGNPQVQKIIASPIQKQVPAEATTPTRASDRLELSGIGHLLQTAKSNDIRTDKVLEIRQQIQDGTYDADGSKLDAAADKLLDELK
jgi:anti-sigma28 factor (negative regulator of flagellin synthesis)